MTACNIACERAPAPFVSATKGREAELAVTASSNRLKGGRGERRWRNGRRELEGRDAETWKVVREERNEGEERGGNWERKVTEMKEEGWGARRNRCGKRSGG